MDRATSAAKQPRATRTTVSPAGQIWTPAGMAHSVSSICLKLAGNCRPSGKSRAQRNQKPGPPAQGRETGRLHLSYGLRLAVNGFSLRYKQKERRSRHGHLGISLDHLPTSGGIFLTDIFPLLLRGRVSFFTCFRHDSNESFLMKSHFGFQTQIVND